MPEAVLAPGARIECRSAEWLVRSLGRSSDGQQVVDVVGVSPFLRKKRLASWLRWSKLPAASRCCNQRPRNWLPIPHRTIPRQPAVH